MSKPWKTLRDELPKDSPEKERLRKQYDAILELADLRDDVVEFMERFTKKYDEALRKLAGIEEEDE